MRKKEYYQTIPDDRELIREYEKENKYWMILETDHPVYPYVEEDDSTRLYRRQADALDYLRCLGLSGLGTLYIEHDELPQMVSGWIPLGVRRIRIYDTPEEYRILQCDDIADTAVWPIEGAKKLPSEIMRFRQNKMDLADDESGGVLDRRLEKVLHESSLLIPVDKKEGNIQLLDDPLITGSYLAVYTNRQMLLAQFPEAVPKELPFGEIEKKCPDGVGILIDPGFHGVHFMLPADTVNKRDE